MQSKIDDLLKKVVNYNNEFKMINFLSTKKSFLIAGKEHIILLS